MVVAEDIAESVARQGEEGPVVPVVVAEVAVRVQTE